MGAVRQVREAIKLIEADGWQEGITKGSHARNVNNLAAFTLILICTVCPAAYAQGDDQPPQGQQPTTTPTPIKAPAPPLFPRHRRGIYRDSQGFDVVDATPQSPPLDADDPNVPDKGAWEINFTTLGDLTKETKRADLLLVDANYGLLPKIAGHELPTQLKIEFPLAAIWTNGGPSAFGVGAAEVGLKFNFYNNERTGLSVAVYPQVEFAPPGSGATEKGLAEPGQTFILPLLVSKEFGSFTFVANGGLEKPLHVPDGGLAGTFGVGLGRALTRRLAAMIELSGESSFAAGSDRLMYFNVGVIRGVHNIILYAKWGHSLRSSDGVSHSYIGGGVKLLIQPGKQP